MIDDNTPDDSAEDMRGIGDNFRPEDELGQIALKLGRATDKLIDRLNAHTEKAIGPIHENIKAFGRLLQEGKGLYPSPKEYGQWVRRRGLDTVRIGNSQQERNACIHIARLSDEGSEADLAAGEVSYYLDLTGCHNTVPTDIIKWARKNQRRLFSDMPPASAKRPKSKRNSLATFTDQQIADEITDIPGIGVSRVERVVKLLTTWVATKQRGDR